MTQVQRSEWASSHAGAIRRQRHEGPPTWDDVAGAYDAGVYHALARVSTGQRKKLEAYMRALRVMNAHATWAQEDSK